MVVIYSHLCLPPLHFYVDIILSVRRLLQNKFRLPGQIQDIIRAGMKPREKKQKNINIQHAFMEKRFPWSFPVLTIINTIKSSRYCSTHMQSGHNYLIHTTSFPHLFLVLSHRFVKFRKWTVLSLNNLKPKAWLSLQVWCAPIIVKEHTTIST